jgi:16S rRNA (guanine527-N7)-methyltransferase
MTAATPTANFREALTNEAEAYEVELNAQSLDRLARYYELLQAWNSRLHLVAPCTPQDFATRHILESLILLKHLTKDAQVVEVGAGGGLPILPCLLVRSDLKGVLIEASQKKAVFLREAISQLGIPERATVINRRFEDGPPPPVEFVTCRALERFEEMLPRLLSWAPSPSTLLLLGAMRLGSRLESLGFANRTELIPRSRARFLYCVSKP